MLFFTAVKNGDLKIVSDLIQNADSNAYTLIRAHDNNRQTALMLAAERGHLEILKKLIDAADDNVYELISAQGFLGYTALTFAAERGHLEIVKKLIDAAGDNAYALISTKNNLGITALMFAADRGHIETARNFLDIYSFEDIFHKDKNGDTALTLAERFGRTAISSLIREKAKEIAIKTHEHVANALGFSPNTNGPHGIVSDYLGFSDYFPSSKKNSRAPEEQPKENNKRLKF